MAGALPRKFVGFAEERYCGGGICDIGPDGDKEVLWIYDRQAASIDVCAVRAHKPIQSYAELHLSSTGFA